MKFDIEQAMKKEPAAAAALLAWAVKQSHPWGSQACWANTLAKAGQVQTLEEAKEALVRFAVDRMYIATTDDQRGAIWDDLVRLVQDVREARDREQVRDLPPAQTVEEADRAYVDWLLSGDKTGHGDGGLQDACREARAREET